MDVLIDQISTMSLDDDAAIEQLCSKLSRMEISENDVEDICSHIDTLELEPQRANAFKLLIKWKSGRCGIPAIQIRSNWVY